MAIFIRLRYSVTLRISLRKNGEFGIDFGENIPIFLILYK